MGHWLADVHLAVPIAISDFIGFIYFSVFLFKSKIKFVIIQPWYLWVNPLRYQPGW